MPCQGKISTRKCNAADSLHIIWELQITVYRENVTCNSDCQQIWLLILSEFKQINQLLFPLKFWKNRRFSDYFWGDRNYSIRLYSLNIRTEIWRRSLIKIKVSSGFQIQSKTKKTYWLSSLLPYFPQGAYVHKHFSKWWACNNWLKKHTSVNCLSCREGNHHSLIHLRPTLCVKELTLMEKVFSNARNHLFKTKLLQWSNEENFEYWYHKRNA